MTEAGSFEVVAATPNRRDDVVTIVGGCGEMGCWCQAPRGHVMDRDSPGGAR